MGRPAVDWRAVIMRAVELTREEFKRKRVRWPVTPKAYRTTFYLHLRNRIARGVREALRAFGIRGWKASLYYSIVFAAVRDVFHYGLREDLINAYVKWLKEVET